jgi:putative membrane protein
MKLTSFIFINLSLVLAYGCSSGSDSADKANKINEERIDKQAVAVSSDAKDEAKDVTRNMVELANTSMTEYELSKVALQKATNPEVKSYARTAMNDHQQDDRTLQSIAKQMNVVLPSAINSKSKNHVDKLNDMKSGTEFDTQYLDYMASINDDALDVADDLKDDAPTDAVKTFAKKLIDDDRKHKDQAKQLKNALD